MLAREFDHLRCNIDAVDLLEVSCQSLRQAADSASEVERGAARKRMSSPAA
jgi:hypothetical protein